MTAKDKALDLALEALEKISKTIYHIETPPVESLEGQMRRIAYEALTAIKQALAAPSTHKTARWTDEEYREISDQVISTLVEYGAELRTADCQMQILREELAESRREVEQLKAQRQWVGLKDAEKQWIRITEWTVDELIEWVNTKLKEKNT
jgi:predicted RNase H-like nuclease (RuvC/YqgF family)